MTIEAVETKECDDCGVQTLVARVVSGDPYCWANVCLVCMCKAFGVETPSGPYSSWQPAPPVEREPDPINEIDHTATISPELQAELDAMLVAAEEEH